MNPYEERQEAKRERLRAAAAKRAAESDRLYEAGRRALEAIPFGQPILVGHYSEKSDRAYRGRAIGKMDKAFKLSDEAKELESRADSVGTGGISSDDPEAISKLDDKLLKAEEAHAAMVEANKEAKANGQPKPYLMWQLSNSRGRITNIKNRIEGLQHWATVQARQPVAGEGWRFVEDITENRFMFVFDGIPSEDTRALLKSRGFKWSPTRKAWVRMRTGNGRFAADHICRELLKR